MRNLKGLLALLLCACMLTGIALAETAPETEVVEPVPATSELAPDAVLATVGDTSVLWSDLTSIYDMYVSQYGSYYDMTQQDNINLFRAVAMDSFVNEIVMDKKAAELGLDALTEEELATVYASADADWNGAIESYIAQNGNLTETSTDEEKQAANDAAIAYFLEAGYTNESLRDEYRRYEIYARLQTEATKDVVVTDEEVEAAYQELLAKDKALYENDVAAYEEYNNYVDQMAFYAMYYGESSDMDYAWYKPAGYRAVKHILLPVDEALLTAYTDLQARLEEQMEAESAEADAALAEEAAPAEDAVPAEDAEPAPEPTEAPVPVTQADVDNAKAAIFASLQATIDEINQKVADGADFDELIATYAIKADGTPTDGGMTSEPYKTSGYEVWSGSTTYVPEFVEAAFSVDAIGDVSAPFLSSYGVHIVKYIGDVEGGPVAMTEEQRAAKKAALLSERQSESFSAQLLQWNTDMVVYTGLTPSLREIQAAEAAAQETQE